MIEDKAQVKAAMDRFMAPFIPVRTSPDMLFQIFAFDPLGQFYSPYLSESPASLAEIQHKILLLSLSFPKLVVSRVSFDSAGHAVSEHVRSCTLHIDCDHYDRTLAKFRCADPECEKPSCRPPTHTY